MSSKPASTMEPKTIRIGNMSVTIGSYNLNENNPNNMDDIINNIMSQIYGSMQNIIPVQETPVNSPSLQEPLNNSDLSEDMQMEGTQSESKQSEPDQSETSNLNSSSFDPMLGMMIMMGMMSGRQPSSSEIEQKQCFCMKCSMEYYHNIMQNCNVCESTKSNDRCSICLEDFQIKKDIVNELDCKHLYHNKCLDSYVYKTIIDEKKVSCPLCRTNIRATSKSE